MDAQNLLSNKTILITGASGFTGGHACNYFAGELGMQVFALVRKPMNTAGIPQNIQSNIHYLCCDLGDLEGLRALIKEIKPRYVLHLGGKNSVPESWDNPLIYMQTNVQYTFHLLDALRAIPQSRVLVVGSSLSGDLSRIHQSAHPYGLSKGLQKMAVLCWHRWFEQDVVVVEPSNLIGPGPSTGFCSLLGKYIVSYEQGMEIPPFQISSRGDERDFLDVRDAVAGYALLLLHGKSGEEYGVSSGITRTLEEIAKLMLGMSHHQIPILWGNKAGSKAVQNFPQPSFIRSLGWKPHIPLAQSLQNVIDDFRTRGGVK